DRLQAGAGCGDDERGGFQLRAIVPAPGLPQAGERERPARLRVDEKRPLLPDLVPPFVEAVGRKEAAPAPHGVTEGGLVVRRLATSIDEQREIARVLNP